MTSACPVCSGLSTRIATYSVDDIVDGIERALGRGGLKPCVNISYQMLRCNVCSLEFASPMIEPGAGFYQWLTSSGFAYPKSRWEWKACWDLIRSRYLSTDSEVCKVLDVGCGDGAFLEQVSESKNVHAVGIDLNPDVVSNCRSKGLEALVGDLDTITDAFDEPIDVITLWHVVEHVASPLKVLKDARSMLSPRGVICFSVPLSPMSYEAAWPDPFNSPPHHLTRWNEQSLKALAVALHMDLELVLPQPENVWRRATRAILLQAGATQPDLGWKHKFWVALRFSAKNPGGLIEELRRQRSMPTLAGRVRPDVALIVLNQAYYIGP